MDGRWFAVTLRELRVKRLRHEITAKELAEHLGVSPGWLRSLEKYYRGPCVRDWSVRYEAALKELVEVRRHAAEAVGGRGTCDGGER
jgi:transcriptional regulator with XRE-family HTH domain